MFPETSYSCLRTAWHCIGMGGGSSYSLCSTCVCHMLQRALYTSSYVAAIATSEANGKFLSSFSREETESQESCLREVTQKLRASWDLYLAI